MSDSGADPEPGGAWGRGKGFFGQGGGEWGGGGVMRPPIPPRSAQATTTRTQLGCGRADCKDAMSVQIR